MCMPLSRRSPYMYLYMSGTYLLGQAKCRVPKFPEDPSLEEIKKKKLHIVTCMYCNRLRTCPVS